MPDADLSATLAEAKRRHHHGHTSNPRRDYCTADNQDWPCDVSRLLTALEAVLKLAEEWEAEAADPRWQITPEDCGVALAGHDHAVSLREAIATALQGKEAGE